MLRSFMIVLLICWLNLLCAHPIEEPTKFFLNTIENDTALFVKWKRGQELLLHIADTIRIGRGKVVNSIILARNIIIDQMEQLARETSNNPMPTITKSDKPNHSRRSLTSVQTTTPLIILQSEERDIIRLENETLQAPLEKRKPDNIRQVLDSFLQPTPIVDGIKENEKFGNTGDKFIGISKTVVNAFENFSNFLNTVVDLPVNVAKQTSRGITESLNHLGARLIGLL